MWCEKCGKELAENAHFCTGCGAPVVQHAEKMTEREQKVDAAPVPASERSKAPKAKKPMSKGKKIALAVLIGVLAIVIAAAALFASWYFSAEQKLLRALDEEDYDTALRIYDEELDGEKSDALVSKLTERLTKVREDFTSGAIDFNTAKMELSAVKNMNILEISDILSETESYVNSLNASRTAFSTAETMLASENYVGAIKQYALVLEIDENYATALSRSKEATDAYCQDSLATADAYAQEKLYSDAILVLQEALIVLPDDARLTEKLRIYEAEEGEQQKADILKTAEDYAKAADYENAIKTIKGTAHYDDDPQLKAAYQKYCNEYVKEITAEVDELITQKDFSSALQLLEKALTVLPSDESLIAKQSEIKNKMPIPITTLKPINGNWKWNEGNPVDPFENDYSKACNYVILDMRDISSEKIEYRLYKKYGIISGQITPYKKIWETGEANVKIYADDILIYTSPTITRKTDTIEFSVDVSTAEYIVIEVNGFTCGTIADSIYNSIIISNVQLWGK